MNIKLNLQNLEYFPLFLLVLNILIKISIKTESYVVVNYILCQLSFYFFNIFINCESLKKNKFN